MDVRRLKLTVSALQAGKTVDTLLRRVLELSGTAVKRAKRTTGGILLDGRQVFVTETVEEGQILSVLAGDEAEESNIRPIPGPLDIRYEDDDLLVLNKAPGIPVHPGPKHYDDTIGNFVADYYKSIGFDALFRPVNRLDRGTSGLMVVAKHAHAQTLLIRTLHSGAFRRIYLAVCDGIPKPQSGVIDAPIGRAEGSALRREVRQDGAAACTRYQVVKASQGRALVRLELDTGRTHQIRVHMAYLGCPLTGDFLYGVENRDLVPRAALHSAQICLIHPLSGKDLDFTVPLPPDLIGLV